VRVVGDILGVPEKDGEVDGDRGGEASPGVWSALSIASSGEVEEWLEELGRRCPSVIDQSVDLLRDRS
jgi:hypothetical protein